jgi:hypothetical protein
MGRGVAGRMTDARGVWWTVRLVERAESLFCGVDGSIIAVSGCRLVSRVAERLLPTSRGGRGHRVSTLLLETLHRPARAFHPLSGRIIDGSTVGYTPRSS